ncbi:MAG: helix-turn-helix domain-containing protein [Gracilibacteraceae bacterium]|jgi:two-component system response regulator YesN|nr:helix-turn-helix domain-containing protein [Gracilibacteraceae bacterium]
MYSVLVIDDKEVFRRKVKRLSYFQDNKDKFEIRFEAQNGLEAIEILRANSVDVTLTDIRMPFIDGIELLKCVNAEGLCKCVILLSEFAEFHYAKAGILNGAFDYVLKPIDDEKIKETFDRVYNYLTTINSIVTAEAQRIETLARLILDCDRPNALAYANHFAAGFQSHALSPSELIVHSDDVMAQLNGHILRKRPYLSYYAPLADISRIDIGDAAADKFAARFSARVMVQSTCLAVLGKPESKISLTDIAGRLFVNSKYLGTLFKKETGRSFVEYVTFVRMERAKTLLRDRNLKIYEIAIRLGYDDVDYFSRVFKKQTAETPSKYRENCAS